MFPRDDPLKDFDVNWVQREERGKSKSKRWRYYAFKKVPCGEYIDAKEER